MAWHTCMNAHIRAPASGVARCDLATDKSAPAQNVPVEPAQEANPAIPPQDETRQEHTSAAGHYRRKKSGVPCSRTTFVPAVSSNCSTAAANCTIMRPLSALARAGL